MYEINELIEYHYENEFLDFKREEYNEQNKPNLIKDILSFSNANIPGDKYIIIGVDKKSGSTDFFNIEPKLDSANIQQYVHENIEPELDIAYFSHHFNGFILMVLQIKSPTNQPYFTSKNVPFKSGKVLLKANECWIRKGSHQLTTCRADFERIYNARKAEELTKDVKVTFEDGSIVMAAAPKFARTTTKYQQRRQVREWSPTMEMMDSLASARVVSYTSEERYNQSFFSFKLVIHNSGETPIEDYKLLFEFVGEIQAIAKTNYVSGGPLKILGRPPVLSPSTMLYQEKQTGRIAPPTSALVSEESFTSQDIYVRPSHECTRIGIRWKLISRDLKRQGELSVELTPEIVEKNKVVIKSTEKERTEVGDVEDYIS